MLDLVIEQWVGEFNIEKSTPESGISHMTESEDIANLHLKDSFYLYKYWNGNLQLIQCNMKHKKKDLELHVEKNYHQNHNRICLKYILISVWLTLPKMLFTNEKIPQQVHRS